MQRVGLLLPEQPAQFDAQREGVAGDEGVVGGSVVLRFLGAVTSSAPKARSGQLVRLDCIRRLLFHPLPHLRQTHLAASRREQLPPHHVQSVAHGMV